MNTLIIRVDWDIDGAKLQDVGLHQFVVIFDVPDNFDPDEEMSDIHERISDLLSDTFGWCHFGWSIELDAGKLPREALLLAYTE